jgi:uncharacterized coiled-coil DUF342 family protein
MSRAEQLLKDILALPREEARELAERVLELTDPSQAEWEDAVHREILQTLKDIDEGREELIPGEVVRAEMREKLARALRAQTG